MFYVKMPPTSKSLTGRALEGDWLMRAYNSLAGWLWDLIGKGWSQRAQPRRVSLPSPAPPWTLHFLPPPCHEQLFLSQPFYHTALAWSQMTLCHTKLKPLK